MKPRKRTAHMHPPWGQAGKFGIEYVAMRCQGVLSGNQESNISQINCALTYRGLRTPRDFQVSHSTTGTMTTASVKDIHGEQ